MMNNLIVLLTTLAFVALPCESHAQRIEVPFERIPYPVHSSLHSGNGVAQAMAFETMVTVPGSPWLRLEFERVDLGSGSHIFIQSSLDGGFQELDSETIMEWTLGTAVFAGDSVVVRLFVAPGDAEVFFDLREVLAGRHFDPSQVSESQCGSTDDRIASSDNRVGRLFFGGCTAWRITNGAFLTAGHCVDFDPDRGGPMLPDGNLDLFGVVEFNVPLSQANGTPVPANPNDQYPINIGNVQWRFDGEGQGLGKDWAVFGVGRNSNTRLHPHEAYGLPFRVSREFPFPTDPGDIRITGFGDDSGTARFTNQTSTGPYLLEDSDGDDVSHQYQVDTEGGNSGSPIIWEAFDVTIGIHTNGGCGAGSGNWGTSFEVDALESALRRFTSAANVRFVDVGHPLRVSGSGTVYRPMRTVSAALSSVPSGGVVSVVVGEYPAEDGNTFVVTKAVRIEAPVGPAVIGRRAMAQ